MNKFNVIALSGLLSLSCSAALAESASLDQPTLRFIPVLVQVNAVGKVVNVSPSADLPRSLDRVLRNNDTADGRQILCPVRLCLKCSGTGRFMVLGAHLWPSSDPDRTPFAIPRSVGNTPRFQHHGARASADIDANTTQHSRKSLIDKLRRWHERAPHSIHSRVW